MIFNIIDQITSPILTMNLEHNYSQCGLVYGISGEMLALGHYKSRSSHDIYNKLFCKLMSNINLKYSDCSLGSGLAGIGWALHELDQHNILKLDRQIVNTLDRKLINEFNILIECGNLDLFSGASGLLLYFIHSGYSNVEELVHKFINKFKELLDNNKFRNRYYDNAGKPIDVVNLGVPHGLLGIGLLLLMIKERLFMDYLELTEIIIDILMNNVRHNRSYEGKLACLEGIDSPSKLAWCYGDLPFIYMLIKFRKLYHCDKYLTTIDELTKTIIKRDDYFTDNLTLCHGITVVTYIFYKLQKDEEFHPKFYKCYIGWRERLIEDVQKNLDSTRTNEANLLASKYFNNSSLFMGYPSLLLVSMTIEEIIDTSWDSCLLF